MARPKNIKFAQLFYERTFIDNPDKTLEKLPLNHFVLNTKDPNNPHYEAINNSNIKYTLTQIDKLRNNNLIEVIKDEDQS